jgi:hypothetical protein
MRRSDGALKNNIVTFEILQLGLQLTFDPTNGQLVAAAVLGAQASAAAALARHRTPPGPVRRTRLHPLSPPLLRCFSVIR